jgi:3-hydroxyisobutyrate dehydrogenase
MNQSTAFLGLGIMGGGMARRLAGAGFPLTIYNRDRAKAEVLAAQGTSVCIAGTPREAATGAETIISMVADDNASRAVWLGEDGALAGARRGAVCVECSTLSISWVKELQQAAQSHGCELIDAPVTGSKAAAAAGQLNFLVGGSIAALDKIRPILAVMGKGVIHLGETGSGAFFKLINNFVCGVQLAVLAEAIVWMEQSELNTKTALALLTEGVPGSPLMKFVSARVTAADYTPNFKLELLVKDLDYAVREGRAAHRPCETVAVALDVFRRAAEAGHRSEDMAAVIEYVRGSQR